MRFWNRIFRSKSEKVKLKQPEDFYQTEITDVYIKVTHPKRKEEQIKWEEIEEIKLINTDEGPFLPDVWLISIGNGKGVIPIRLESLMAAAIVFTTRLWFRRSLLWKHTKFSKQKP